MQPPPFPNKETGSHTNAPRGQTSPGVQTIISAEKAAVAAQRAAKGAAQVQGSIVEEAAAKVQRALRHS